MTTLPAGWVNVKIEDIADVNPRKSVDLSPEDMVTFVPMAAVSEVTGTIKERAQRTLLEVNKGFTQFAEGDVLFAKITPSMENGKSAVATDLANGIGFGSTEFHVFRTTAAVLPDYLWLFLRQQKFRKHAQTVMSGAVGQQRVPSSFLKTYPFLLPPVSEQERIVSKARSLLLRTNRASSELSDVPQLLKNYRARVLSMAFNGQLIGRSGIETMAFHDRCWNLPAGWRWAPLGDVAEIASNPIDPLEFPDLPHVAPDNIESGTTKLLAFRTLLEDSVISRKQRFFPGQVLYSKIRPYLKKAVLVDFDGACSADIYALNCRGELDAKFLLYWLVSDDFAQFSAMHERRSVLPKINRKALSSTPLPLPPLSEQREIVKRLDKAFAWIDRVLSEYNKASRLIPSLEDSIGAMALRGELVKQVEDDEPATSALARVAKNTVNTKVGRSSKIETKIRVPLIVAHKLVDVLEEAEGWLSAQEAFKRCGIAEGAETNAVELIYGELRMLDKSGRLEIKTLRDSSGRKIEDLLRLTGA